MIRLHHYSLLFLFFFLTSYAYEKGNNNKEVETIGYSKVGNINSNVNIKIEFISSIFNSFNTLLISEYINFDLLNFFEIENYKFENVKLTEQSVDKLITDYISNISKDYIDSNFDSLE